MSEHWKSTPRYWCKHCTCYVRDTKLERQNHEATARHQGALKRSLRDLHRNHEREEREKERARQEVARLNGIVTGGPAPGSGPSARSGAPAVASEAERQRQREQLAALGVAVPSTLRADMAMAGEWTVTSTRVVGESGGAEAPAVATGVRRREETDEQREEQEAVRRLFKKPRRWGRDSKAMPEDEDRELDALLSGTPLALKAKGAGVEEDDNARKGVKDEAGPNTGAKEDDDAREDVKDEAGPDTGAKAEDAADVTAEAKHEDMPVKQEPDTAGGGLTSDTKPPEASGVGPAPVVFKKRKPKGIRAK